MGSPVMTMLGNASLDRMCGPQNNDPELRRQLNCPPLEAAPPPGGAQTPATMGPAPPTVTEMGLMKQASPQLAGTMNPAETAGVRMHEQLSPAVDAAQAQLAPNMIQRMLLGLFGRGAGQ